MARLMYTQRHKPIVYDTTIYGMKNFISHYMLIEMLCVQQAIHISREEGMLGINAYSLITEIPTNWGVTKFEHFYMRYNHFIPL